MTNQNISDIVGVCCGILIPPEQIMEEFLPHKLFGYIRSLTSSAREYREIPYQLISPKQANELREMLPKLKEHIGSSFPVTNMFIDELSVSLEQPVSMTFAEVGEELQQIGRTLEKECATHTFAMLDKGKSEYAWKEDAFGKEVSEAFPGAVYDIEEAGHAYACTLNTACVFHLMRSLEVVLYAYSDALGIPPIVKEADRNWGKMLEKIKIKMDEYDKNKPLDWDKKKGFMRDVYATLIAVKDAWRNTTMHVENKYEDDDAKRIFDATRSFMQLAATQIKEKP